MRDLGSRVARRLGSSPSGGTICRCGGMADTRVLKTLGKIPCGFESRRRHHMSKRQELNTNREFALKNYYESPNYCKYCGKVIEVKPGQTPSKARGKTFCDLKCCHLHQKSKGVEPKNCKNCGRNISSQNKSGLCSKCLKEQIDQQKLKKWLDNGDTGTIIASAIPLCIRRYIFDEQSGKCAICGQGDIWNKKDLHFVLDHIDGDASNSCRENLRLICPNCDSQLDTFKSKNRNSARSHRKIHKADEPGERPEPT